MSINEVIEIDDGLRDLTASSSMNMEQITTQYPALLVTGPRQAGKTTMLEPLAQKEGRGRETVTLDDLTVRELAKTDPKMFFQLHKPPLLIDEVQYAPELFPIEIKKMAAPPKELTKVFELIGKSLLERGTGAVLCMADRLGAFDQDNLIVPISLI